MRLQNKAAIITGAGGGFGRATAIKFAKEGARLSLVDLNETALRETEGIVKKAMPQAEILCTKADVSSEGDVNAFIDATVQRFGALDILFNNAGIEGITAPIDEMPFDLFQRDLAINLHSVFLGMKYAIAHMKNHGGGSIISTASAAGIIAFPFSSGYVASKHGIIGLTKAAAVEYGAANIRTNAICPGAAMTELHKRTARQFAKTEEEAEAFYQANAENVPMKRYAKVEEIADAAVYLASDESSYVNGISLMVDGGFTIV